MIRLETTADRVIGAPHDPPARGERFPLRVPLGARGRGRLGLGLIGRGLAPVRGEFVLTRRPGVRKGHRNALSK